MPANIPGLDEDRMRWSYPDLFMYTLIWNVSLAAISVTVVWLTLLLLKWRIVLRKPQHLPPAQHPEQQQLPATTVNAQHPQSTNLLPQPEPTFNRWHNLLTVSTSIFFYLMLISASLIFLAAFMFGKLGVGTGKAVLAAFIMWVIVAVPTILWKLITRTKEHKLLKTEYIVTGVLLLLWIGVCAAGVIMTQRACLCVFNDRYGVTINKDFKLSTQFSRAGRGKVCQNVCHVYATLPEDTDTSVFFNFHTGTDISAVQVAIKPADEYEKNPIFQNIGSATKFIVGQDLEQNGQRNLFSILFNNLKPNTQHVVRIQAGPSTTIFTKYRTLPSLSSPDQMRIAFGGDVGMTDIGSDLTLFLSAFDPHAIVIGGDIAYDDAMATCYYSWDTFYQIFEGLNNKLNRIVPLVLTVGNHDVGFDALATVQVSPTKEGPFFFAFHPQHYADASTRTGIPDIENRSSIHYHKMGKILMLNLDSGYLLNYEQQRTFIEKTSQAHRSHQRIANYHNPIYPTCSNPSSQPQQRLIGLARTNWVPLFESNKFLASLQHHTHHFKYSKPLTNGTEDQDNGVVYVGDGCWGVYNDPCSKANTVQTDIFAAADNDNSEHVWMMTVKQDTVEFKALDGDGNTKYLDTRKFRVLGQ